jgi:cold shock CspA family protein
MTTVPVRLRGVVQRWLPERGYGFIRALEGAPGEEGTDYFLHRSALEDLRMDELREGLLVDFLPTLVAKGPRAEHVRRAEG